MSKEVNDIICFDVWLMIIEIDPKVFCLVRAINRAIRDYTNKHIDKYMNLFKQILIPRIEYDSFGSSRKWSELPNGNKHGKYIDQISPPGSIVCNYKNGLLDGYYREYFSNGYIMKSFNYKDGLLDGAYKEYYVDGFLHTSRTYKNGVLDVTFNEPQLTIMGKMYNDMVARLNKAPSPEKKKKNGGNKLPCRKSSSKEKYAPHKNKNEQNYR